MIAVALVVLAYVVGMFPTALLIGRRDGVDPSRQGSGNPGASNVFRLAGARAGAAVLAGDVVKGVLATGLGLFVEGRPLAAACWVAVTVGHVFPILRGFRGGKGVATGGGGSLVLFPIVGVAMLALFAVVVAVTRTASLGSLTISVGLVVGVAVAGRPAWEVGVSVVVAALVMARHHGNIQRLLGGRERVV